MELIKTMTSSWLGPSNREECGTHCLEYLNEKMQRAGPSRV